MRPSGQSQGRTSMRRWTTILRTSTRDARTSWPDTHRARGSPTWSSSNTCGSTQTTMIASFIQCFEPMSNGSNVPDYVALVRCNTKTIFEYSSLEKGTRASPAHDMHATAPRPSIAPSRSARSVRPRPACRHTPRAHRPRRLPGPNPQPSPHWQSCPGRAR